MDSEAAKEVVQKDRSLWQVSRVRRLVPDLVDSLRNPEFWTLSAWLDIVITYRRSRLGILWLLVPSAVYAWGVGLLFGGLLGGDIYRYVAYVGIGFTVYGLMNMTITQSTRVFVGSRAFIMDGRMRLTDFVLRCVAKAFFHLLMAIPVLASALVLYGHAIPLLHALEALGGLVLVLINTFLAGVIFSVVGARFPDIHELIGNLLRVAVFLTPIIWLPEQMPEGSIRGVLARLNPFYHLLAIVRAPILGSTIDVHTWYYVGVLTVVSAVLAVILYRRYARLVPVWL